MSEELSPMVVDEQSLRALAHPLRIRLYERLNIDGPATASQLAERLAESSGATSYHLRQLARHGFIEEEPARGTKRERWWRVRPGGFTLESLEFLGDPRTRADTELVVREVYRSYAEQLAQWFSEAETWPEEWTSASIANSSVAPLTHDELAAMRDEVMAVLNRYVTEARSRAEPEGAEQVIVHFHAFPRRRQVKAN
jgi:DNA-binding transcriptional ArsR family regulator